VIAVDTSIVVYAHREDAPHHAPARDALASLASDGRPWAVPWACLHEFLAIVTHRKVFDPPSPMDDALAAVSDLLALAGMQPLAELADHSVLLGELLTASKVSGAKVHDARVAAICLSHGVDTLWTADRDFSYFPSLHTANPLLA